MEGYGCFASGMVTVDGYRDMPMNYYLFVVGSELPKPSGERVATFTSVSCYYTQNNPKRGEPCHHCCINPLYDDFPGNKYV